MLVNNYMHMVSCLVSFSHYKFYSLYILITGQAGGPPVYINLVVGIVLVALFYLYSQQDDNSVMTSDEEE